MGGPIRKNKTFFFVDGEQKYQRQGIVFTGLVPSLAMRGGDFSADPFGNTLSGIGSAFVPEIANPNMVGAENPYFQCDASTEVPSPRTADGSQPQGANCDKIPSNLMDHVGKSMMNLYPPPNVNAGVAAAGYNYVTEPVRALNETKFDVRLDHAFTATRQCSSRDSATIRRIHLRARRRARALPG